MINTTKATTYFGADAKTKTNRKSATPKRRTTTTTKRTTARRNPNANNGGTVLVAMPANMAFHVGLIIGQQINAQ